MITDDRITGLEQKLADQQAQITALAARDARREQEHRSLLRAYEEASSERERLRQELAIDHGLLTQALDLRLEEFATREPSASGPALPPELALAITRRVAELLGRDVFTAMDTETASLLVALARLVERLAAALASQDMRPTQAA